MSKLEIELAATKKEIFLLFDKVSDVEGNMKNKMERVKLDHTTVVGKFKEFDWEFKKLFVFVSKLERSSVSSLVLNKESSMVCRILKLVQKLKEKNRQQYAEIHEDVTSLL